MNDFVCSPILDSTLLKRNSSILASGIDDELVIMDGVNGLYFGLNPTARRVWELLGSPLAFSELLRLLMEEYKVDLAECRTDTETLLQEMEKHQLVSRIHP